MVTYIREAQFVTEVLCTSASSVRVAQFTVEVLCTSAASIRLGHYTVEALLAYSPKIRVANVSLAALYTQSPKIRVANVSLAILGTVQKTYLTSSTLSLSDEATYLLGSPVYNRTVEDPITLEHVLSRVIFDIQNLEDSVELSDEALFERISLVSDSFELTQELGLNYYLNVFASSELTLDETVGRIFNDVQLIDDIIVITDTLAVNYVLNLPRSDTVVITDEALGSRIKFAGNTVIWSQTVAVLISNIKLITSTLVLVDTVALKKRVHKPILQWLAGNDLLAQHTVYWLRELPRSTDNSINLNDTVALNYNLGQSVNTSLTLTHSAVATTRLTANKQYYDTFELTQAVVVTGTRSDTFTQSVVLQQSALGLILNARRYMLLQAPYEAPISSIILPNPILDDGEHIMSDVVIKKAMDNTTYSYVKRTPNRRLTYTFQLNERKGDELRAFTTLHNADSMKLQNWKGEIWRVHLMTNPVEYTAAGRWGPVGERIEVNLEFEGVRTF